MVLSSAPLLIDAKASRTFLESAQRLAGQISRVLRTSGDEEAKQARVRLDDGIQQLRELAAPLLLALNRDQRAAVASENPDPNAR